VDLHFVDLDLFCWTTGAFSIEYITHKKEKSSLNTATTTELGLHIFIEVWAYTQKYKLLEFSFGGRKEILQSQTGY